MANLTTLQHTLEAALQGQFSSLTIEHGEINIECEVSVLKPLLSVLKQHEALRCDQLSDLCAVDYLHYGQYDWETESATDRGFSRGVEAQESEGHPLNKPRFAVVYHLLSTVYNHRMRVKSFIETEHLVVPSVHDLWKVANWFEREAYDLYGILFENHPDLRRILTDYGFIGHPFRKDFPLSGHIEMRYDAELQKVIYEPVNIERRVLVPKVIRHDNRYLDSNEISHD